jgi:hypothetical protein
MRYLVTAIRHPRDYDWRHLRPWQRHSLVLTIGGFVYALIGITYLTTAPSPERRSALNILDFLPLAAWGGAWCLVGALAIISSRWPPASKTWGYTAMSGLAWCWGTAYLMSATFSGALVWALVGFMWWAIAGLANPDDLDHYHATRQENPADRAV